MNSGVKILIYEEIMCLNSYKGEYVIVHRIKKSRYRHFITALGSRNLLISFDSSFFSRL